LRCDRDDMVIGEMEDEVMGGATVRTLGAMGGATVGITGFMGGADIIGGARDMGVATVEIEGITKDTFAIEIIGAMGVVTMGVVTVEMMEVMDGFTVELIGGAIDAAAVTGGTVGGATEGIMGGAKGRLMGGAVSRVEG
jgi:hypothetical protein